jgi:Holliday junction resolvase-like predicted endonuclease
MTNYAHGKEAEVSATEYLKALGYKITEMNWRTRYCEIDIIAEKSKTVFFVEVKYRQTSRQGAGLEYITSKKLKQMSFAAEMWVQNNDWRGAYQLAAIAVTGPDYQVSDFVTDI